MAEANRVALAHVRAAAQRDSGRHLARISSVLADAGVEAAAGQLLDSVAAAGVVTLNFHPDRLVADGRSVAEALCEEGVYRGQFETAISGGGLSAFPGGNRDVWERALFGGAYQAPGVRAVERPKYGGLNLMNFPDGACPGFGSCHLRLQQAVNTRASLIFGDSNTMPTDVGLIDALSPVLAPLVESIALRGAALGRDGVSLHAFVDGVLSGDVSRRRGVFAPRMDRQMLDDYIEAQVHGVVSLAGDVDAIVIDPAFTGTPTGELLQRTANRYRLACKRHPGCVLELSKVPSDVPDVDGKELMRWHRFCAGGRARRLAQRVIEDYGTTPHLDAANIGQAAVSLTRDPDRWQAWGTQQQVRDHLKDLWVIVLAHGEPPL